MPNNKYLVLYATNIPVRGINDSAIYLLNKGSIFNIPHTLFDLIEEWKHDPFQIVTDRYKDQRATYLQYVDFITNEDIGFFTDTPELFPPLKIQYPVGEVLKSATISYNGKYRLGELVNSLNLMNCKLVELRLGNSVQTLLQFEQLISLLNDTTLRHVDLFMNYPQDFNMPRLEKIIKANRKLNSIMFCESGFTSQRIFDNCFLSFVPVGFCVLKDMEIAKNSLVVSVEYFMESTFYNPLYCHKVYIDDTGRIKNYEGQKASFGNIRQDNLREIVSSVRFQKLWQKPIEGSWLSKSERRYALYNPVREATKKPAKEKVF